MSKKVLIIVAAIVLLVGGGVVYLLSTDKAEAPKEANNLPEGVEPNATSNLAQNKPNPQTKQAGQYIVFSEDAFNNTTNKRIIFFHAPWCPQCRDLDKDISSNSVPAGVTIFKTDYDTNQALRQKYGVTLQTTVVLVDENGNLVKKFVAYDSPTLNSVVNNLL